MDPCGIGIRRPRPMRKMRLADQVQRLVTNHQTVPEQFLEARRGELGVGQAGQGELAQRQRSLIDIHGRPSLGEPCQLAGRQTRHHFNDRCLNFGKWQGANTSFVLKVGDERRMDGVVSCVEGPT